MTNRYIFSLLLKQLFSKSDVICQKKSCDENHATLKSGTKSDL